MSMKDNLNADIDKRLSTPKSTNAVNASNAGCLMLLVIFAVCFLSGLMCG